MESSSSSALTRSSTALEDDPASWPVREKGRLLEDFKRDERFEHHWGRTLTSADNLLFCTATLNLVPRYINATCAQLGEGDGQLPIHPMLAFCIVFGLSVEDLNEGRGGGPFLGVEQLRFHRAAVSGDTLRACSTVIDARPSSKRPRYGVATWLTEGFDQHDRLVLDYRRTNLVARRDA